MKKGQIVEGIVNKVDFPNKGYVVVQDEKLPVIVKNVLVGQKVSVRVTKKRSDKCEGNLIEVLEKAPNEITPECGHFGICGGCSYQNLSYDNQLELKKDQVISILKPAVDGNMLKKYGEEKPIFDSVFEGIKASPISKEYRNKMEFSFGDGCKGGELELGLHKKGSFYDIVSVKNCQIIDEDYRAILNETLSYFRGKECTYYHKLTHEGFLRHLLVRKAVKTGEILICLVTSSQIPADTPCCEKGIVEDWKDSILALNFKGTVAGILHIINDSLSDVVQSDETKVLYGRDYINEEVLGLKFKITPFSFFQTNTLSAEVIYSTARDMILGEKFDPKDAVDLQANEDTSNVKHKVVFDLYSGTGTIAQLIAPVADKVIGVEIIEEAVVAARENAKLNGLNNCEFIAGDVLKVIDEIADKPDFIILDPPRDGVHPKALKKIIDYGVDKIIYISCKPTSLARDFEMLIGCGYEPERIVAVDQFPGTNHVETVVLMSKKNS